MHQTQEKLLNLISNSAIGELSYRKIAQLIGAGSAQIVKHHLEQLDKKNFIVMNKKQGVIRLSETGENKDGLVNIPIISSFVENWSPEFKKEMFRNNLIK